MAQALQVSLTAQQEEERCRARDHHETFSVRVKAAGILKVAHGSSVRQVAQGGLLKPVRQETVSEWIERYLTEGLDGLLVRAGRGRKPAFFPSGI